MFSENLVQWITDQVKDEYTGDISGDIEAFSKSLELKTSDEKLEGINKILPQVLEEMANAPSADYLRARMDSFSKVEPFLKHVFGIAYPERSCIAPRDEENGLNFREWTLAPLLKQGFNLVPRNYNLSTQSPANMVFRYKPFYDLVYNNRNDSAHDFTNMKQREIFSVVEACLIVYLDVSGLMRQAIEDAFNTADINSGFSSVHYCRKIVAEYRNKESRGFAYVDIKWQTGSSHGHEYSTVHTFLENNISGQIKLLGEAGCGKTTILKQLEYLMAAAHIEDQNKPVPVYMELGKIEKAAGSGTGLIDILGRILCIEEQMMVTMLEMNKVCLLLDGFNEILDMKIRKQFSWALDNLTENYPEIKIFISDRALLRSAVNVLRDAVSYRLYPLDNPMKISFIMANCHDSAAREMLLKQLCDNPGEFEKFATPIRLMQLIELTSRLGNIPENFDDEYIRFLFNREMIEKNDENVEYLEPFACSLALCDDEEMSEYKAEACLAKCKRVLGYSVPDSRKCLRLMIDMGILDFEDGCIRFKYASYRNYFWMLAFDKNLVDLLEE